MTTSIYKLGSYKENRLVRRLDAVGKRVLILVRTKSQLVEIMRLRQGPDELLV